LWGRNSTAGSINVSTRRPTDEFEIFGDVLGGSYNQVSARGVINVPIVEDRVAMRVAGYVDHRDGYQDNLFYPGTEYDANDARNWGLRPQLSLEVVDDLVLTFRGNYNHQGGVGWNDLIQGPYPGLYPFAEVPGVSIYADPYATEVTGLTPFTILPKPDSDRQTRNDTKQFQDISSWDVNGTLTWNIQEKVAINIVGSYRSETREQNFDADRTEAPMLTANTTASTQDRVVDAHIRSVDPVALGDQVEMEWLAGFFFLDADGEITVNLPGPGLDFNVFNPCIWLTDVLCIGGLPNPIVLTGAGVSGSNYNLSLAPYLHTRFLFAEDTVQFGAGVRFNYDKKRGTRVGNSVSNTVLGCIQPDYATTQEEDWNGVTGDLSLEYKPTDENMVYGKATRGWKPGYINGDTVEPDCNVDPIFQDPAKEEVVYAFEIGSKNRFFDNSVQANLTGFYNHYHNLQVLSQLNSTTFIANAQKARTWGIEFEGIWQPTFAENLSLSVVYGYLNAKYVKFTDGYDFATSLDGQDFSGNRMIRAPKHTATVAAEYLWEFGSGFGVLVPRVQYTVSADIYFSASNRPESLEPSFGKLRVSMRWESEDANVFVEGFGDNLTDVDVRSTRSVGSGLLGYPVYGAYEPPRTWGIRIGGSY
jgi:iron complex outermembrane receptor protein